MTKLNDKNHALIIIVPSVIVCITIAFLVSITATKEIRIQAITQNCSITKSMNITCQSVLMLTPTLKPTLKPKE